MKKQKSTNVIFKLSSDLSSDAYCLWKKLLQNAASHFYIQQEYTLDIDHLLANCPEKKTLIDLKNALRELTTEIYYSYIVDRKIVSGFCILISYVSIDNNILTYNYSQKFKQLIQEDQFKEHLAKLGLEINSINKNLLPDH